MLILLSLVSYNLYLIYGASYCDLFSPIIGGSETSKQYPLNLDLNQNFAIGIWTRYTPGAYYWSEISGSDDNFLIYYLQPEDGQFPPISYVLVLSKLYSNAMLQHKLYRPGLVVQNKINIDKSHLDGYWIFSYIGVQISAQLVRGFYYNPALNTDIYMFYQNDFPIRSTKYSLFVAGQYSKTFPVNEQKLITLVFHGQISQPLILNTADSYLNDINTFKTYIQQQSCTFPNLCQSGKKDEILIKDVMNFNSSFITNYLKQSQDKRYGVSFWAKIDPYSDIGISQSVILRVTNIPVYGDDVTNVDRLFFIRYQMSNIAKEYGIYIQINQNSVPDLESFQSTEFDKWEEYDSFYYNALTQWHFIYFQYGLSDIFFNTEVYFYFQYQNKEKNIKFRSREQFRDQILYFIYGGDSYTTNYWMKGSIAHAIFHYCNSVDNPWIKTCHYSCDTCNGPTGNDCLTCKTNSFRTYISNAKACACQQSYIDIVDNPICQKLNEMYNFIQFNELPDNSIQCKFGEFQINNVCYQCPQLISNQFIYCADCVYSPNSWGSNPLCTQDLRLYDSSKKSVFEVIKRKETEYEYYLIDQVQIKTVLCQGCKGLKTAYYQSSINVIINSNNYDLICKSCYQVKNGKCVKIDDKCIECDTNNICKTCQQGYGILNNQCLPCSNNCLTCQTNSTTNTLVCTTCHKQYALYNSQCYQCGQYCDLCEYIVKTSTYMKCYKCIDTSQYLLSMDGVNCIKNDITNCQYAAQVRPAILGSKESSLDLNYNIKTDLSDTKTLCFLCQSGYTTSLSTGLCENLSQTSIQSTKAADGTITSLISSSDTSQVKVTGCLANNCKYCITDYYYGSEYCVECQEGFYSNQFTGFCIACPTELHCQSCVQQHKIYKDGWKISIIPYYTFYINDRTQKNHLYNDFVITTIVEDYEIECQICLTGYELSEGVCIKSCPNNCHSCKKINNENICIECGNTIQDQMQSTNNNECLTCPYNCVQCRIVSSQEYINKLFNPEYSSLIPYSYQCLKKVDESNLYYDTNTRLYIKCNSNSQLCIQQSTIELIVYCDDIEYQTAYNSAINKLDFTNRNIKMNQLFSTSTYQLEYFETLTFLNEMNKLITKKIIYKISFKYNSDNTCKIPTNSQISSRLYRNIYSLKDLELNFYGDIDKFMIVSSKISIIGYNIVKFYNIKFRRESEFNFQILHQDAIQFYMQNIQFIDLNKVNSLQSYFYIQNPNILSLISIKLDQINLVNIKPLFYYDYMTNITTTLNVILSDITIQNSIIQQSKFIQLATNTQITTITVSNINLESNQLNNFQLIYNSYQSDTIISIIIIQNIKINLNQINNSILIQLNRIKEITLQNVDIQQNTIIDSKLFLLFTFKVQNLKFLSNTLINSQLLSNALTSQIIQVQMKYIIENMEITQNTYTLYRVFLEIRSQLFQSVIVQLSNIKMEKNNLVYDNTIKTEQILYDYSTVFIQATNIILNNFYIIRGIGYPEITITDSSQLEIINFEGLLDNSKKIKLLNSQLSCITSQYTLEIYNTLILLTNNKQIKFDSLKLHDLIIVNEAIILIISESKVDVNNQESIIIQNSIFDNNKMIVTQSAQQQSIILIISEQKQNIQILNNSYSYNHQHSYIQDITYHSAATIQISSALAQVIISKCQFNSNIVTNSHDSIIFIKAESIKIDQSNFQNSNNYNYSIFRDSLIWGTSSDDILTIENLQDSIYIQSYGGCGFITGTNVTLLNNYIEKSYAQIGGAFYIEIKSTGTLIIQNNQFYNCSTTFIQSVLSQGGTLYIDGSQSILNLLIENLIIKDSKSRNDGGSIYILQSATQSIINMKDIHIMNTYSLMSAFLFINKIQQSTIKLTVSITNLLIINNQENYMNFLSNIDSISLTEQESQQTNYLITITNGKVELNNIYFTNIQYFGNLLLLNLDSLLINTLQIYNQTIGIQSLLKFTLNKNLNGSITLIDITLNKIINNLLTVSSKCNQQTITKIVLQCIYSQIPPAILEYFNSLINLNIISQCNQYKLQSNINYANPLITIDNINYNQQLYISDTSIIDVYCPSCQQGLILISNVNNTAFIIDIQNIQLRNNTCGMLSCIIISSITTPTTTSRLLVKSDYYKPSYTLQISKSQFINNKGTYGGALLLYQINTLIVDSEFQNNIVSQVGGAIYFKGENQQFNIYDSIISNNQASIGGGIYLSNYVINPLQYSNIFLTNNRASFYGDNFVEFPSSLSVSINGNTFFSIHHLYNSTTSVIDLVAVQPYQISVQNFQFLTLPSGQAISEYQFFRTKSQEFIDANLRFRIFSLNRQQQIMKNLDNSICSIDGRIINKNLSNQINLDQFYTNYTNQQNFTFNTTSQDYNLDKLIIKFDPNLNDHYLLQLRIQCDSIKIPVNNLDPPYTLQRYNTNYTLLLNVQTFQCQRGETKSTEDGTCVVCDALSDQFTVRAGDKCSFRNQVSMEQVTSARVKLRPEYWRPYETDISVEYCINMPENCDGGWEPGDKSCHIGHIGALCEQCDIYNTEGNGAYSVSTIYKCGSCAEVGDNTNRIVLISFWTLISILISVNGNINTIEQAALSKQLQFFGFSSNPRLYISGILIKVLTNYFQIVGTITTFQLQIPSALSVFYSSVGSPIEAMSYSLDCFLVNLASDSGIQIHYFRLLWGFFMPIFYIFAFFIIYGVAILIGKAKKSISVVSTTLIFMYIYLQPTLIGGLVALVSFRHVSGYYWVQGNVAYRYDTSLHQQWLLMFVLPSLIVIAIAIPFYMFRGVKQIKFQLDKLSNRKTWGYLYNEYKQEAYFWEIVKILQKGLIIIFLTFYEDLIVIKASLIFIIVFAYSLLLKKYSPYQANFLNIEDQESTLVCGFSIVLGFTIYTATKTGNQEIVWPFYIMLIVANALFILKIIYFIVESQLSLQEQALDKIRDKINEKYPNLKDSNAFMKRILTNQGQQRRRVKARYMQIRQYLFKIAKEIIIIKNRDMPDKNYDILSEQRNSKEALKSTKVFPETLQIIKKQQEEDEKSENSDKSRNINSALSNARVHPEKISLEKRESEEEIISLNQESNLESAKELKQKD